MGITNKCESDTKDSLVAFLVSKAVISLQYDTKQSKINYEVDGVDLRHKNEVKTTVR